MPILGPPLHGIQCLTDSHVRVHSAALLFICPFPVMLRGDFRFWEGRLSDSQARPVLDREASEGNPLATVFCPPLPDKLAGAVRR